ncbi:MAG: fumarate hydratase [Defluviitaleaceae bacterium]|nr:fumarate hydratase [Defluviitaleaceae bacterium]
MRTIEASALTPIISRLCIEANCRLPQDVKNRIEHCRTCEDWPIANNMLDKIIENYNIAETDNMPICQDTGVVCVFLEIGEDVHIKGHIATAVDEGVRMGYKEGYLRNSVVVDPLFNRKNTGDNTPAMLYTEYVPGDKITITVAPKGFGSENMSRVRMLKPSDGIEGVIKYVLRTVERAGPNPCPPIIVGVGVGGTIDKAALLSKKALMRPIGVFNKNPLYAALEIELLTKVNHLGIGPQGFGGRTTALSVAIEYMPTHIAGLPCAVNINCHVARHVTEVL